MCTRHPPDDGLYGTALQTTDRTHLYREYDVDRALNDAPAAEAPPDYHARRSAILGFYGGRCGRCLAPVDRSDADEGVSLGYLYSVADPQWALESLVALCEPCNDLLSAREPHDLDRPYAAPDDAPQFPAPLADPRVAVERVPLSGREAWLRKRLAERVDGDDDRRRNERARGACLALPTDAATAVAYGEALLADWTRSPEEPRLIEVWESLPAATREAYADCAVDLATVGAAARAVSPGPEPGEQLAEPDPLPALPASGADDGRSGAGDD